MTSPFEVAAAEEEMTNPPLDELPERASSIERGSSMGKKMVSFTRRASSAGI